MASSFILKDLVFVTFAMLLTMRIKIPMKNVTKVQFARPIFNISVAESTAQFLGVQITVFIL